MAEMMSDDSFGGFGLAPIKFEGGIANPDEYKWDCWCETCKKKYTEWKAAFDEEQARFK